MERVRRRYDDGGDGLAIWCGGGEMRWDDSVSGGIEGWADNMGEIG